MRRLCKLAGILLLLPVGSLLAYIAIAYALLLFPLNATAPGAAAAVQAYVITNDVHTDLVFPLRSSTVDWEQYFPKKDFAAVPADAAYIAIGWGDRDFYLNTPEWKDLTFARAVGALAGRHATVLHVSYLRRADLQQHAYRLALNAENYRTLVDYVLASAEMTDRQLRPVPNSHQDTQDAFYEARGKYSLFNTCNSWVGDGLRRAGVKVSRWTPFDTLVVWHLARYKPD
ncbi:TIGR02117 family protein [Undibacterium sp.]|jgi:uncharacterized protein (TIGR02117 family)|uniref:TIGR02117 family protein n=1 Tax=Undibacterium sp. TaxID=1914977 RepID=UPI002C757857|nr:TIGR02117 family protein [Undibacterium sp.]HTD04631.1 TIGR02117 family protein [Undibacterium sp.]